MAAAIYCRSWLNVDKAILTDRVVVRRDLKAADHTPAVQLLLVMAQLLHMKTCLVGEVTLDQKLAGEIVVPRERTIIACGANVLSRVIVYLSHAVPLLS